MSTLFHEALRKEGWKLTTQEGAVEDGDIAEKTLLAEDAWYTCPLSKYDLLVESNEHPQEGWTMNGLYVIGQKFKPLKFFSLLRTLNKYKRLNYQQLKSGLWRPPNRSSGFLRTFSLRREFGAQAEQHMISHQAASSV